MRPLPIQFLPAVAAELRKAGVVLKGCPRTRAILPEAEAATEEDWSREYLDLILSVRVVTGLDEAIAHIEKVRLPSHRGDRHRKLRTGAAVPCRSQLLHGPRQCLHPLQRRLRAGSGCGNRHQHDQAPRLRADGAGRAYDNQIHHIRKRTGENMTTSEKARMLRLRFVPRHCGVRQSTPHSSGFARLACGLFAKSSHFRDF